jgi:hypothetical protein
MRDARLTINSNTIKRHQITVSGRNSTLKIPYAKLLGHDNYQNYIIKLHQRTKQDTKHMNGYRVNKKVVTSYEGVHVVAVKNWQ